ncbi:hypothetical protein FQR65_LT20153 [Abscondita terminalis]|nr:hypothetical protein FQR65_LT20153 [Abscondita terminalis]
MKVRVCSFFDMNVISEKFEGVYSVITFRCSVCNVIEKVRTGHNSDQMNSSLVLGTITAGIGYAQINELFAAINIPLLSNKTYLKHQNTLAVLINKQLQKEATIAAQEEANQAILNGDISENGIPIISVIIDGTWNKLSYRTN